MNPAITLGLALAAAGAAGLYLASPNQRWLSRPWPARPARWAGGLLLASAGVALLQVFQAVAAVFVLATWSMLCFVVLPYLGGLFTLRALRKES